jgi:hypothetical protein
METGAQELLLAPYQLCQGGELNKAIITTWQQKVPYSFTWSYCVPQLVFHPKNLTVQACSPPFLKFHPSIIIIVVVIFTEIITRVISNLISNHILSFKSTEFLLLL